VLNMNSQSTTFTSSKERCADFLTLILYEQFSDLINRELFSKLAPNFYMWGA